MTNTSLRAEIFPHPESAISFTGTGSSYWRILARGTFLSLISLGIYRFWMISELRQNLWSSTTIGRDRLEYTGQGRELFFGFLLALAILAPVYVLYIAMSIEATNYRAILSLPLLLVFYLFGQFAIFRARRYRLTRTIWRGVRFWMSGSGFYYMLLSTGWMILVILSFGLALPWREAALERYKMSNTHYGDLHGAFAGTGLAFLKRGIWLWLAVFIDLDLFMALAIWNKLDARAPAGPLFGLLVFASLVAAPFAFAAYRKIEILWWIDGLRMGKVRFKGDRDRIHFAGLYWKMIGSMLLAFLVVAVIFGGTATIDFHKAPGANLKPADMLHSGLGNTFMVMAVLIYVGLFITMGMLQHWFLQRGIWKIVVNGTSVENLSAADHVKAMGQPSNALGEGLAAALDLSGF